MDEDDYQPIRALNDLLFCERRCALHRLEQVWVENRYTLEGVASHQKVHGEPSTEELGGDRRLVRGLRLRSDRLMLIGVADAVEFRGKTGEPQIPLPVEYKRGRRRRWDNDDVQLCAQAICLEEMFAVKVPTGAIYHVKSRRRREVAFDQAMRARTEAAAQRLHELFASGCTPPPVLKPRCQGCSLRAICLPETLQQRSRADAYQQALFVATCDIEVG